MPHADGSVLTFVDDENFGLGPSQQGFLVLLDLLC